MEFTYQSTMQLPASYAVLSEDEMVYTVGGAFELNIDRAAVAQFVTNVISNSIRLAGQYTFQMAFDGLTNMRNDGLTIPGAVHHYWSNQTTVGKVGTVVGVACVGYAVYIQAVTLFNTFLSIYNDMRDIYNGTNTQTETATTANAALAAA